MQPYTAQYRDVRHDAREARRGCPSGNPEASSECRDGSAASRPQPTTGRRFVVLRLRCSPWPWLALLGMIVRRRRLAPVPQPVDRQRQSEPARDDDAHRPRRQRAGAFPGVHPERSRPGGRSTCPTSTGRCRRGWSRRLPVCSSACATAASGPGRRGWSIDCRGPVVVRDSVLVRSGDRDYRLIIDLDPRGDAAVAHRPPAADVSAPVRCPRTTRRMTRRMPRSWVSPRSRR